MSLQAALLSTARWDLGTRQVTRPLLGRLRARAARGEELDPQLHANLAIELAAGGDERERAVRHARAALLATRRLLASSTSALPETIAVLLFAGHQGEAQDGVRAWLRLARDSGWQLSAAVAASVASLIAATAARSARRCHSATWPPAAARTPGSPRSAPGLLSPR